MTARMVTEIFYWLISASIVATVVARQLIREQLVSSLVQNKHHLSQAISNWVTSGDGFVSAIKNEYVWGPPSAELLVLPYARRYVLAFRVADAVGIALLLLAFAVLAHDLLG
jgi:hypothetical protein